MDWLGGAGLTVSADIPDLDHFRGSYGAKAVIPLYRDASAQRPNVLPGLLELISKTYGCKVGPEDSVAYIYGIMANQVFTERFETELETRELRVPLTRDAALFET